MNYTIESLIEENQSYHAKHKVTASDLEKVNEHISVIESSRLQSQPKTGDRIQYTSKYGDYSAHAHIDYIENNEAHICLSPYTPFVFISNDKKEISCSTSGGPWTHVDTTDLLYVGEDEKEFVFFGHCGACEGGAIRFTVVVNVWKYAEAKQ